MCVPASGKSERAMRFGLALGVSRECAHLPARRNQAAIQQSPRVLHREACGMPDGLTGATLSDRRRHGVTEKCAKPLPMLDHRGVRKLPSDVGGLLELVMRRQLRACTIVAPDRIVHELRAKLGRPAAITAMPKRRANHAYAIALVPWSWRTERRAAPETTVATT